MKAIDLNLPKDLKFDFENGITTFHDNRLLIYNADSIGLLRQMIIEQFGMDEARKIFLKFGFQNGYTDFMLSKLNYKFDSEMDLLASGPVIHTWEGIVSATPKAIEYDREKGTMNFTGVWNNSFEAEQHLSFNETSKEPVCWSLTGYASGWASAFLNCPILALEPKCVGKGDDHCEWDLRNIDAFGDEAKPYIEALNEFYERMQ